MRKQKFAVWALTAALMTAALPVLAQQDDIPILRPKSQTTKPASATLLVTCDLVCNWKIDGEAKGRIDAGGSAKVKVELGQHVVYAVTEDGLDKMERDIEIKTTRQTIVRLALQPVHDDRLKAEQQVRDKADQEARDKAAKETIPGLDHFSRPKVMIAAPTRVSISAGVAGGLLVQKTAPVYPLIAREARVSGTVVIQITITKTGTVENLHVVSGPTMLRQPALDAVQTWRYKPYFLNGEPVDVDTTASVNFSLGG
jgi:TonB family protein